MSLHHRVSTMRKYKKAKKSDDRDGRCPFCKVKEQQRAIRETSTMLILPNRTSYDFFEGFPVLDHLMIIPKQHREDIGEFTAKERGEMFDLMAEYEKQGYHFFGRGYNAASRSVKHQHTHLIKISRTSRRLFVYLKSWGVLLAK